MNGRRQADPACPKSADFEMGTRQKTFEQANSEFEAA
jgi:hypothetical protein